MPKFMYSFLWTYTSVKYIYLIDLYVIFTNSISYFQADFNLDYLDGSELCWNQEKLSLLWN